MTRITAPADFVLKNIIDTAVLQKSVDCGIGNLIDLGTGNGIPGLFISILNPDLEITLIDSIKKKIDFVDYIISELNLKNCSAVCGRIETVSLKNNLLLTNKASLLNNAPLKKTYYEKFDAALGRALAELGQFIELSVPFVKTGGYIICQKSHKYEEELKSAEKIIKLCQLKLIDISEYQIEDNYRIIVKFKKEADTPKLFPRGVGKYKTKLPG
ncbi:MAG TPA: 16S rRNA (guanine(527)-N(7))-methyltransferase RsmG [bacterium]|nr:16S rRNA (guanine(527)-N(7))-methyltransferase RsmG [bacterium]